MSTWPLGHFFCFLTSYRPTVHWFIKLIYCLINNLNKVVVRPLNEIIVGCHDGGWSVTLGFSLLDCLVFLCPLELLLPPISQTARASIVCSLSGDCVMYKRVQPVSLWRQVWGYLRKVLKHAWWQDDKTTLKRERRGREGGEVSEEAVWGREGEKAGLCSFNKQWRKWCEW